MEHIRRRFRAEPFCRGQRPWSFLAEQRTVETLRDGKPSTPFLSFGDTVKIDVTDTAGKSIFGSIEQVIQKA